MKIGFTGDTFLRSGKDKRVKPLKERGRQLERARRLLTVSQLWLTGNYNEQEIAEHLATQGYEEVTEGSVRGDIANLTRRWEKVALANADETIQKEIAKLNTLEEQAIQFLNEGYEDKFIDWMLKISKRRSCLLGLDKAKRVEVTGANGGPLDVNHLSDAELLKFLEASGDPTDADETGRPDAEPGQ